MRADKAVGTPEAVKKRDGIHRSPLTQSLPALCCYPKSEVGRFSSSHSSGSDCGQGPELPKRYGVRCHVTLVLKTLTPHWNSDTLPLPEPLLLLVRETVEYTGGL